MLGVEDLAEGLNRHALERLFGRPELKFQAELVDRSGRLLATMLPVPMVVGEDKLFTARDLEHGFERLTFTLDLCSSAQYKLARAPGRIEVTNLVFPTLRAALLREGNDIILTESFPSAGLSNVFGVEAAALVSQFLLGLMAYTRYLATQEHTELRLCITEVDYAKVATRDYHAPVVEFLHRVLPATLGFSQAGPTLQLERDEIGEIRAVDCSTCALKIGPDFELPDVQGFRITFSNRFQHWSRILDNIPGWLEKQHRAEPPRNRPLTVEIPDPRMALSIDALSRQIKGALARSFALAPAKEGLSEQYGPDITTSWNESRRLPVAQAFLAALGRGVLPISPGIGPGISSDFLDLAAHGRPGWEVQALHCPARNRHPYLRIAQRGADGQTIALCAIGFKGAGVQSYDISGYPGSTIALPKRGHLPFTLMSEMLPDGRISRRVWGAQTDSSAELTGAAFLHTVMLELDGEYAAAPLPLTSGKLTQVPFWKEDGSWSLKGIKQYLALHLPDKSCELGVYPEIPPI